MEAAKRREEKRQQAFIPPEEPSTFNKPSTSNTPVDLEALKAKIKKAQKGKLNFKK